MSITTSSSRHRFGRAEAGLYLAMRGARVSRAELARRLGCDEKEVRRMLDPKQHSTRLPKLQQALEALGKCLVYH